MEKGEDGLTAAERLQLFDRLPKAIRDVLHDAPYNYDVRDIRREWFTRRALGARAKIVARDIALNALRHARSLQGKL